MLPNLSPPQNVLAEAVDSNIDNVLVLVPNASVQHHSTIKPISGNNMGQGGQEEGSSMEDRIDSLGDTPFDEDTDMSDGGAALAMTSSHAEQLNAELDMLDAEIMGSDNLVGLLMDSDYPLTAIEDLDTLSFPSSPAQMTPPVLAQETMDNEMGAPPSAISSLPDAMSAVAQQLQHIQDGQGHDDSTATLDAPHGALHNNMDAQFNLSLIEFLYDWAHSAILEEGSKKSPRGPSLSAVENQREIEHNRPMLRRDLQGEKCDIQRLNWAEMGVSRVEARQMRRRTYKNYANIRAHLQWHPRLNGARLSDDQDYFRFRKMDFSHTVHLSHFQLRNLLSCGSRDHIYYAGRSAVHQYSPASDLSPSVPETVTMDLTNPILQPIHAFPGHGVQISTLTVAHDILVAGGFSGEYGMTNLKASADSKHSEGVLTHHVNGITNHVQVYLPRNSASPVAAFASNDMSMRILDIATNKLIAEHQYEHAINCSAVSPDQRLRVAVGDSRNVMICNAETGEVLQDLDGHRDYGFACDWADNGWTVATGNQDMQVKIWDARKWKSSSGIACPVATIASEIAGARKLKFSPLGSGKRVLVAAEPADFVNIIDAETFSSKQTLGFFGEIGGVDFTNDGQDLIIANCDGMRGGIMEFERCNFAIEGTHALNGHEDNVAGRQRRRTERDFDWKDSNEALFRPHGARGTEMQHNRRAALLGTNMGIF